MSGRAAPPGPRVLFRVAAGPRLGFGHLVRGARLAAALGAPFRASVRSGSIGRAVAASRGASLLAVTPRTLHSDHWDAVVVDDPSARHAAPWIRAARARGVLAVSIHDLGLGAEGADIVVDGSLGAPYRAWSGGRWYTGPQFAVLAPPVAQPLEVAGGEGRRGVLVSLGGGPRVRSAVRLAEALRRAGPLLKIKVAPGLAVPAPALVGHCRRLDVEIVPPDRFGACLGQAEVAILAGGVSLYEAAAARTPAVAVAIAEAQRPTLCAFARAGLARDAGGLRADGPATAFAGIAHLALTLLSAPDERQRMATLAGRTFDGRGAARVADVVLEAIEARRAPGRDTAA